MSIGRNGIKNFAFIKDNDDDIDKFNNNFSKTKIDELSLDSFNLSLEKDEPVDESSDLYKGNKITAKGYILILGLSSTVFAGMFGF